MNPNLPPSGDDKVARNRFILLNLVRIGGTAIVLFGLVAWQGDVVRAGGAPLIGIPLVAIGLVASFLAPQWMLRAWRTPPAP